jgi:DNA repair protein RecO (recombination protein O)
LALLATKALCVRRFPYSETSLIVWLYTRELGLIKVLAKGAFRTTKVGKSQFDGGVDLLEEGSAVVTDRREKDLNLLTEWKLLRGRRELRQSSRSLAMGLYVCELVGELFEQHQADPGFYDKIHLVLDLLASPAREGAMVQFVMDLLSELGIPPRLDGCVVCDRALSSSEVTYFSPARGGTLCEHHAADASDSARLSATLHATLLQIQNERFDLTQMTRRQAEPINRLLMDHIQRQLQRELKLRVNVLKTA